MQLTTMCGVTCHSHGSATATLHHTDKHVRMRAHTYKRALALLSGKDKTNCLKISNHAMDVILVVAFTRNSVNSTLQNKLVEAKMGP